WVFRIAEAASKACKVSLDAPWKNLPKEGQKRILYGLRGEKLRVSWGSSTSENHGTFGVKFEGVVPNLERLFRETTSEQMRESYRRFFRERPCTACKGRRLRADSLAVLVGGTDIGSLTAMTVQDALAHVRAL